MDNPQVPVDNSAGTPTSPASYPVAQPITTNQVPVAPTGPMQESDPNMAKKSFSKSGKTLFLALVAILVVGFVLFLSKNGYINLPNNNSVSSKDENALKTSSNTVTNPIFNSVNAQISGKVTKIDGTTLYVSNTLGARGVYKLSPSATLASDIKGTPLTKDTAQNLIPLNKDIMMILEWKNNEFQIVSIKDIPFNDPPEVNLKHTPSKTPPTSNTKNQN